MDTIITERPQGRGKLAVATDGTTETLQVYAVELIRTDLHDVRFFVEVPLRFPAGSAPNPESPVAKAEAFRRAIVLERRENRTPAGDVFDCGGVELLRQRDVAARVKR